MSESSWAASRPIIIDSLDRLERDVREAKDTAGAAHKELRMAVQALELKVALLTQKIYIIGACAIAAGGVIGPLLVNWIERVVEVSGHK